MKLVLTLISFLKVTIAHVVLYQPQNTVSVNIGATAVILCDSSDSLDAGTGITWHLWRRNGQAPVRVKSCLVDNDSHKYGCRSKKNHARLEIYNVNMEDSGEYYCMFSYTSVLRVLGNGTTLIVEDNSAIHGSIHLLAPALSTDLKTPTQLICIVTAALCRVHVTWNISGRHLKGRLTSVEENNGTCVIQNVISLSPNTWNYGDHATCEVWFNSSPVQAQWIILKRGPVCIWKYPVYIRYVLILVTLLMFILIVHLSWTTK